MFVIQLLAILISMVVYIFWFLKSEFVRVLDRIDQATLGLARLQREVGQSTLNALNDQISETLSGLQEDMYDDLGEEGGEEVGQQGEGGQYEEEGDEFQEEEDIDEPDKKRLEPVEELDEVEDMNPDIDEALIESVIDELDKPEEEETPAPRKRGRKPKK
jgi:hypothetical protein